MSHFSLAVFHYQDENVDSLLEPFDEGAEGEKYIAYTRQEAIDYVRTNFQGYKNASDEECWNFMAEGAADTDEAGNIYSTSNPDAKWDWWEEGGRWNGLLKVGNKRVNSALVKDIDFTEPFSTFAVLTPDGDWHEQGFMGCFGMYAPNGESDNWDSRYKERFIDTAAPDLVLTIVDCHI